MGTWGRWALREGAERETKLGSSHVWTRSVRRILGVHTWERGAWDTTWEFTRENAIVSRETVSRETMWLHIYVITLSHVIQSHVRQSHSHVWTPKLCLTLRVLTCELPRFVSRSAFTRENSRVLSHAPRPHATPSALTSPSTPKLPINSGGIPPSSSTNARAHYRSRAPSAPRAKPDLRLPIHSLSTFCQLSPK